MASGTLCSRFSLHIVFSSHRSLRRKGFSGSAGLLRLSLGSPSRSGPQLFRASRTTGLGIKLLAFVSNFCTGHVRLVPPQAVAACLSPQRDGRRPLPGNVTSGAVLLRVSKPAVIAMVLATTIVCYCLCVCCMTVPEAGITSLSPGVGEYYMNL